MSITAHAEKNAFVSTCHSLFADQVIALFEGDNYVRIPDMALTHPHHFILILKKVTKDELDKIRVILSEFPNFYIHPLSENDIEQYPQHGLWQFVFRRPLLGDWFIGTDQLSDEAIVAGIQHSLIEVSHVARKYFLSDPSSWNTIWATRSGLWMLKVIDHGVLRLWHYLQTKSYPFSLAEFKEDANDSEKNVLDKIYQFITHWEVNAEELMQHQDKLDDFLLLLNDVVEQYVRKIAATPIAQQANVLLSKQQERTFTAHENSFIREFTQRCYESFGEDLLLLLLSGSQARGDANQLSDVDTISIFRAVDANILCQLKNILSLSPKFSSYILSADGFAVYPPYRNYTFQFGCKHLAGSLDIAAAMNPTHLREGMRQTLLSIVQLSREYYIRGSFSLRTINSIRWQAKMFDFGYLRLLLLLEGKGYPENREDVYTSFKDDPIASRLFDILQNSSRLAQNWRTDLLQGDRREIERKLLTVNDLVGREMYARFNTAMMS